ncbi:MAG: phosphoribosylanthranilate isomerase [Solirubrobacteraceae bacterium]|nr:phosphoribosylanthranilate isomerase [Solirubrobacteraceae bacterium]
MTRVKICGTTNLADARLAVDLGAWAVGMIFVPGTPRAVRQQDAVEIGSSLRREVQLCGVFVNAPLERVTALADGVGLTMLQLHGDEGPAYCAEAARRTGCRVIKAARVDTRADVVALEPFHTDFHLLDAHVEGVRGGTGETWDWELVAKRRSPTPLIVSGGLRPDNVAQAIAATRPYAVDVASGVEASPGQKDPAKLDAFMRGVRPLESPALRGSDP